MPDDALTPPPPPPPGSPRRVAGPTVAIVAVVSVLLIGALALVAVGRSGSEDDLSTTPYTFPFGSDAGDPFGGEGDQGDEVPTTEAPSRAETVEVAYPGPGASIAGETPCPPEGGASERTTSFAAAPPTCIDAGTTYRATVETTEGTIVVELDSAAAPVTVNNFVVLARYRYYEDVPFHRIIPGFVNQAGTPVDQASPEIQITPGYEIDDELPASTDSAAVYPEGTIAMANRGSNPDGSGTNTSQFFIVVGDGGSQLQVAYTPFGRVVEGIEVARAINEHGDAATNGTPTKAVTITRVTISEA